MSLSKFLSRYFAVPILSLGLVACGGGGGGGEDPDAGGPVVVDPEVAPSLLFTTPANNASDVEIVAPIEFVFDKLIDPTTVTSADITATTSVGTLPTLAVGADGARIRVTPMSPLPRNALITIQLDATFTDTDGNAPESGAVLRFDTEEAIVGTAQAHEFLSADARLGALSLGANGSGMSMFRVPNGQLWYRRIEFGVPVGSPLRLVSQDASGIEERNLDVASNGDVQAAWRSYENSRNVLRLARWDAVSETWGTFLNLTPGALSQLREVSAEVDNFGGMVAWTEESTSDNTRQAIRVGFPEADGFMDEPITLRLADARRHGLKFERSGTQSVLAWMEGDAFGGLRVAYTSHDRVAGFGSITQGTAQGQVGRIFGVAVSSDGHRFVLLGTRDSSDPDRHSLALAVARPGEAFGAPQPLFAGTSDVSVARIVANDDGVAGVMFAREDGDRGIWLRRWIPATGFEAAVELTAVGQTPRGIESEAIDIKVDDIGNIVALASHASEFGRLEQVISAALLPRIGAPRLGIVLDRAEESPTGPRVRILVHPNTSSQMVWTHRAEGLSNYDVRTRRLATNGVAGPIEYYETDSELVVSELRGGFAPSGRGLLIWSLLDTTDDVRQILFDQ